MTVARLETYWPRSRFDFRKQSTKVKSTKPKPLVLTRRKRFLFSMITCTAVVILIVVLAESLTRIRGFRPLAPVSLIISIEGPGDYFTKDSSRGYAHGPGEFKLTVPEPYTFKVTHSDSGLRITHPPAENVGASKRGIWIFGCSFTHGWRLNDEETYPWLLQRSLTDYEVVNFAVDGYSTVQSLVQFQESLKARSKPTIVVVAYAWFHDSRNQLTRAWKKALLTNSRLGKMNYPYAELRPNDELVLRNDPLDYAGFLLLRYSALANYLDDQYNASIEKSYRSHDVSKAVLDEFWNLSKSNGIEFVLAGINRDPVTAEMLESFSKKGAMTIDISVDTSLKENNNLPYDGHPSAIANKQFAQKLEAFLVARLIDKTKTHQK